MGSNPEVWISVLEQTGEVCSVLPQVLEFRSFSQELHGTGRVHDDGLGVLSQCTGTGPVELVPGTELHRDALWNTHQVRVHGLADCVRDGVLLRVLRRLRPCEHTAQVPAVRSDDSFCASPSVHRQSGTLQLCHSDRYPPCANYAEDRRDSFVQFLGKVVELPLLCNDRCWG